MSAKYCKYGNHMTDWVPYGSTNVAMESFECTYDGKLAVLDTCDEDDRCPAFEGMPERYDEDERV
jgi:hypothetical protein